MLPKLAMKPIALGTMRLGSVSDIKRNGCGEDWAQAKACYEQGKSRDWQQRHHPHEQHANDYTAQADSIKRLLLMRCDIFPNSRRPSVRPIQ